MIGCKRSKILPKREIPLASTMNYGQLFKENYYPITERETNSDYNIEISNASINNPLSNEREYYLGVLFKSKYDGIGLKEPIDIGISIGISNNYNNLIDFCKKLIIKFVGFLNEKDNICINCFDHFGRNIILSFQEKSKINNLDNNINFIEENYKTDIYKGLLGILNEFRKNTENENKMRRIIIFTNNLNGINDNFINLGNELAKENIFITILGLSGFFDSELIKEILQIENCNFYHINNEQDFDEFLTKKFNLLRFPISLSLDNILEINGPSISILSAIGSRTKEIIKNKINLEWNKSCHKFYNQNFREAVFYMLCYFKRHNKILPLTVISCISKYIQTSDVKNIIKIETLFPSDIKEIDNKKYIKGNIILLRLDKNK